MNKLLIIANSARMLAQAARDSGFIPFVIDCYGDQETKNLAEHYRKVSSLKPADLLPALEFFKQQYQITQLIYGSGFELHSDSLIFLAQHFEILGNAPKTFIALQNKPDFFQRLQQLNINHPEISFSLPKKTENWLIKPQHSLGGLNIQHLSNIPTQIKKTDHYYQRYIKGESLSVLFLANGKEAKVIGFNQQLTTALDNQPFVFAGIINHAELSLNQRQTLTHWINQLTLTYDLRGLNSLDFMLSHDVCYVLEINPRPPASMQLYDADLLTAHLAACRGKLNNIQTKTNTYKAYHILYAQKPILIPEQIEWLKNCVDLPSSGVMIGINQPICSIIASDKNLTQLLTTLQLHKHCIFQQLSSEKNYAISSQR